MSKLSSSLLIISALSLNRISPVYAVNNHYDAPHATVAPQIDGKIDEIWQKAQWDNIDVRWNIGIHANQPPTPEDYTGRYKVLWDQDYIYMLFAITDDILFDATDNPVIKYWEDDTVEVFFDEDNSGGDHDSDGLRNQAFAYHVSLKGDNIDWVDNTGPRVLTDHLEVKRLSRGSQHSWEMRIKIYDKTYQPDQINTPVKLTINKVMGFTASYIDNDGGHQREHMFGSVDTPEHDNNQGYLNADSFGTLKLIE